eukprot:c13557_g1_i1 orf=585-1838(-)
MGVSGKWIQLLTSSNNSKKASTGKKHKISSHGKLLKWRLWNSSHLDNEEAEEEQDVGAEHALTVATASSVAAEAVVDSAAVVHHTIGDDGQKSVGEECAAVIIQTAFRGFLARRALHALRGLVRLQALVRGHVVRKQTVATLHCMQALVRVQMRVCAHRAHMLREGQAAQRKIEERYKLEAQHIDYEEGWCDSIGTLEDIQAKAQQKQAAAIKRERALAYAFSNQWKSNSSQNLNDVEPDIANWGWSWLERWMARSCENLDTDQKHKSAPEKHSMKYHSVKLKRHGNSGISNDDSQIGQQILLGARSRRNMRSARVSADSLPSIKDNPEINGGLGLKPLPVRPTEWRAFSNPKQRPPSDTLQAHKRLSLPNQAVRSAVMQKLQTAHKNTDTSSNSKPEMRDMAKSQTGKDFHKSASS